MTRVMFVCYGNICRSPMAEFVFKKMVKDRGLEEEFEVASSATSTEEIPGGVGRPMYRPAREELTRQGIPFSDRRAVQLTRGDAERYDLFVGMDNANVRNMHRILGADAAEKIYRMMDFTDRGGEVADPWYTGDFEATYRDVTEGCAAILKQL